MDADRAEPATLDRRPGGLAGGAAGALALLSAGAAGLFTWSGLALGVAGLALLSAGLLRGGRRLVTAGGAGLVAAGLLAGLRGAPAAATLLGVAAGVAAWDLAHRAVGVGEELGRAAASRRLEGVHVGASVLVGGLTAGLGYGVYQSAAANQPAATLAFLVVAAALAAAALS